MWLFTIYGFFSASAVDNETLAIRARSRNHLVNLQAKFPTLAGREIVELPNCDYKYRIAVPKAVWAHCVSVMVMEQTWSNFKNEVGKNDAHYESGYEKALHRVWADMLPLQLSKIVLKPAKFAKIRRS